MTKNAVLVDTSVWIDYFRGENNPTTNRFNHLILHDAIVICPLIVQELLQGVRDEDEYKQTKDLLDSVPRLHADAYKAAMGAADLLRKLRRKGITIRKSNDCLIAWFALETDTSILHKDRDFDLMVKPLSLRVVK